MRHLLILVCINWHNPVQQFVSGAQYIVYSIVYAFVKASDAMLNIERGRRCHFAVFCRRHTMCGALREDDRNWYLQMPHLVLRITRITTVQLVAANLRTKTQKPFMLVKLVTLAGSSHKQNCKFPSFPSSAFMWILWKSELKNWKCIEWRYHRSRKETWWISDVITKHNLRWRCG